MRLLCGDEWGVVFSYLETKVLLTRCVVVCSEWNLLIMERIPLYLNFGSFPSWLEFLQNWKELKHENVLSLRSKIIKEASLKSKKVQVTEDGAKFLSKFINLTHLTLYHIIFGGGEIKHLKSLTKLGNLSLRQCFIERDGILVLSDMTSITTLDVRGTFVVDFRKYIYKLTHLTTLYMDVLSISSINHQVKQVSKLINLTIFYLRNCSLTSKQVKYISQLSKLTDLNLNQCFIRNDSVEHLSNLTNLTRLGLRNNSITCDGVSYLSKLTKLVELRLRNNPIKDLGMTYLLSMT